MALMLFPLGDPLSAGQYLPPYLLGFLLGFGSGAAMIPYSIIKEVNPDNVKGSATGAINFLVFVDERVRRAGCRLAAAETRRRRRLTLDIFTKGGGSVGIAAIVLAAILALFLRETGSAATQAALQCNA